MAATLVVAEVVMGVVEDVRLVHEIGIVPQPKSTKA